MIILRNSPEQREYSNAGIYIKNTLKCAGKGALGVGIVGGLITGFHPLGFLGGAIFGGTLGGIIGAATAKFQTPEEKAKREKIQKERKAIYNKVYKELGLGKLIKIPNDQKIVSLLKKSECRGWDDYIYVTLGFESDPWDKGYFDNLEDSIAWFGNIDEDGELILNFLTGEARLGKTKVNGGNFKSVLLNYQRGVISKWEKEFKEKGKDCGCNQEFIDLQKEIYNQTKRSL